MANLDINHWLKRAAEIEEKEAAKSARKAIDTLKAADGNSLNWAEMNTATNAAAGRIRLALDGEPSAEAISTGLDGLDDVLYGCKYNGKTIAPGGMAYGRVYTLTGTTGFGKTALALQIADKAATRGVPVLYVSLESSISEMITRSAVRLAYERGRSEGLDIEMRARYFTPGAFRCMTSTDQGYIVQALTDYQKTIAPNLTFWTSAEGLGLEIDTIIAEMENYCTTYTNERPLIVLDYLQLIQAAEGARVLSEKDKLDQVCHAIKAFALKSKAVVLMLSSLNRGEANKSVKTMSGLSGSGQIEYTSDCVIVADFEKSAKKEEADQAAERQERMQADERTVVLSVVKNRAGRLGSVTVKYRPVVNHFVEAPTDTGAEWGD